MKFPNLRNLTQAGWRYRFYQLRHLLFDPRRLWETAIPSEIAFWEGVMQNAKAGSDHPYAQDFRANLDPQLPLKSNIAQHLEVPMGGTVDILDVGAGPLSRVGKVLAGYTIRLTAIDPLAEEYDRLLKKYDFQPVVRTQKLEAEKLQEKFAPASFDLIFSHNALDHAYEPLSALQQAVQLLKPKGVIYLMHHYNGGSRSYEGFHQWSFGEEKGQFIIWNLKHQYVVADHLPSEVTISTRRIPHDPYELIEVIIKKF